MISYVEDIKEEVEYNKLREEVGWGKVERPIVKKALNNTLYSISAYDFGEIVGYGRLIGDGGMFIYIQDIMVTPKYQNQKIGTTIMKKLLSKAEEYQKKNPAIRIYVGPDKGKEDFYRKFGFKTRKEMHLGEGMIMTQDIDDLYIYNWEEEIDEKELDEIINILDNDGLIIFPTDTVYGLACNCFSEKAINKIFDIKKRAKYKPINVLTDSYDKILKVVDKINPKEEKIIKKYMPGALTIILDKKKTVPDILTASLPTIGVRIPNNKIALEILKRVDYPLATTSANISGKEAGIKINDFINEFDGKVDAIIDGGETEIKKASTIVRVEENHIDVIREGTVKIEEE